MLPIQKRHQPPPPTHTTQGSTELWEWDSAVAAEAFALHDALLRAHLARFRGYEVSTEGDAFLVAFREPFDAAAFCLAVQIALHCESPSPFCRRRRSVV